MKMYRVHGYRKQYIEPKLISHKIDEENYFTTLEDALTYIERYIDKENVWAIEVYNGFIPEKFIARNTYE